MATSAADAKAKLALDPEAVLVEVVVFGGPGEFTDVFAAYRGAVWALVARWASHRAWPTPCARCPA